MPASSDLEAQSSDDESSEVVTSRDEPSFAEDRKEIWKMRRITFGIVATFLASLYFAWDGSNENAAFRAAFFAVPAAGFLIAQVVFEVQHRRANQERLEAERDVTGRIAEDGTV